MLIDMSFTLCRNLVLSFPSSPNLRKQRQLNLDLELAQQNLKKAQDEVAGMEGNCLSTAHVDHPLNYPFDLLFDLNAYFAEK